MLLTNYLNIFDITSISQDTGVLGKNGRLLSILSENRGIESRRQLLFFKRTTETRKKKGDKFGNEDPKEGTPAKRTTLTR